MEWALAAAYAVAVVVMIWDVRARRRERAELRDELGELRQALVGEHLAAQDGRALSAALASANAAQERANRQVPLLPPIERHLATVTRDDDPVHLRATVPEGTPAALVPRLGDGDGDGDRDTDEELALVITPEGRKLGILPPPPGNDRAALRLVRPPAGDRPSPEPA